MSRIFPPREFQVLQCDGEGQRGGESKWRGRGGEEEEGGGCGGLRVEVRAS